MKVQSICKNCDKEFVGNFCPNCGQSASTRRIDAHYLLHDIPHSVLHIDKGLPYTFLQLSTNPGKTLLDYLKGKRVRFFKPFAYVIILSTISSLFIKKISKDAPVETSNTILTLFSQYPSILIFTLIQLVALISWFVFRKRQFNFWEHFLVHTYLAAQINIILIILHLISISGLLNNANMALKLTLFNSFYMTFHGFTFSSLFTDNYKQKFSVRLMFEIFICCFLLGCAYAFALIYAKVAGRWF